MFPSDSIRVIVVSKYFQLLVDARCFHETIKNIQYAMDIPYLKIKLYICRLTAFMQYHLKSIGHQIPKNGCVLRINIISNSLL